MEKDNISICLNGQDCWWVLLGIEELLRQDLMNPSFYEFDVSERKELRNLYKKIGAVCLED